ncbi:MAG: hypothetical protein AAFX09_06650 [Pseudomonadota bacterium]
MGQELETEELVDEAVFLKRLRAETRLVMGWFHDDAFERRDPPLIGAEVEGWLLDADHRPCPRNLEFLGKADDTRLDQELSQYNFELNLDPGPLQGDCFAGLQDRFEQLWSHCSITARSMNAHAAMIGIAPTLRTDMLDLEAMTPSNRYRALNARVMHLRGGAPMSYCITGQEVFEDVQDHLMMEAACTSLQTHLMLDPDRHVRQFNAALIASGPVMAVSGNSPFLNGKKLWEETRIPLFEQAINVNSFRTLSGRHVGRVGFGAGYVRESLLELFLENLDGHAPLLPVTEEADLERLRHLKLQNGTVWRWNRPIVCADAGTPHIRLENRITPAGPTPIDMTANAAFLIGLTLHLADRDTAPETELDFEDARANFYSAAEHGLGARITWLDGDRTLVQRLIHDTLADQAEAALVKAGVSRFDARRVMDIIRARATNGMTGSAWQRAWANVRGRDFQGLTEAYVALQESGRPVHTWTV